MRPAPAFSGSALGRPVRVLLVDDDSDDSLLFERTLARAYGPSLQLTWTQSFETGLQMVRDGAYDVHFVDYRLGAANGLDLMASALRDHPFKQFVIVTGYASAELADEARRRGAAGLLAKHELSADLLAACIKRAVARPEQRKESPAADPLTGLLNGEWFAHTARMYVAGRLGSGSHWALLFIDIDNFEHLREGWGQDAANETLRGVGQAIRNCLAETEPAGRVGADEFCVLATCAGRREAAELAEQVRGEIESRTGSTASIGVALEPARIAQLETLIANASVAALDAGLHGRNRVEIWQPV